jgi:ATP-dependent protease ClpP protease subunit
VPKIFNCFEVKNETENKADLYFYGDIVSDWWGAWQDEDQYPNAVKDFLTAQAGKDLNIYINSGGGSVFAGIAIYNMIQRHAAKNKVQVYVDGLAGSIASVIAFAGSEPPKIPSNAFFMIHNPWSYGEGNAAELRKMADDLDEIAIGMLNIYGKHLKDDVSIDTIKELMDAETWLNGEEAAKYFNVEVTDAKEYAAAVGDYMGRADREKIPKGLLKKPSSQEADKAKAAAEREAETIRTRNALMRNYLEIITQ